jgi:large subunit ribosomal protein L6
MSRIGKKHIVIPGGVKVEQQGQTVKVSGPKGTLQMNCHPKISVAVDKGAVGFPIPVRTTACTRRCTGRCERWSTT